MSLAGLAAASAQNSYEARQFVSSEGDSLNYRLLTPPQVEARKKYPLVIFLHGSGERGSDNEFSFHNARRPPSGHSATDLSYSTPSSIQKRLRP